VIDLRAMGGEHFEQSHRAKARSHTQASPASFLLSVDNPAYDKARVGAGDAAGVTGFDATGAAAFLFAAASAAAASFAST
jgi:hypothetical protein